VERPPHLSLPLRVSLTLTEASTTARSAVEHRTKCYPCPESFRTS
jgi:hypothetical protein